MNSPPAAHHLLILGAALALIGCSPQQRGSIPDSRPAKALDQAANTQQVAATTLEGKILEISATAQTISIAGKDSGQSVLLSLSTDTAISEAGQPRSFADLHPGQLVAVTIAERTAKTIAITSLYEATRRILPDFSEGTCGLLGPFAWGRSCDIGAEARFCDEYGQTQPAGDFLWLYQVKRPARSNPPAQPMHERNNLVNRDPHIAYTVQPWRVTLNTPQPHQVMKLMFGYVDARFHFQHGDNADLIHLADTPRVVAFIPIRRSGDSRAGDQTDYILDTTHDQAPIGVFELAAKETMASGPMYRQVAIDRVLYDLRPFFKSHSLIHPGIMRPMFQFSIGDQGTWALRVELDGRDGLAGGEDPVGWDHIFTQASPGARPSTVGLTPANSAWSLSIFNPGGAPESSDVLIRLLPFDRKTGLSAPWTDRSMRLPTCPVQTLIDMGSSDILPATQRKNK